MLVGAIEKNSKHISYNTIITKSEKHKRHYYKIMGFRIYRNPIVYD